MRTLVHAVAAVALVVSSAPGAVVSAQSISAEYVGATICQASSGQDRCLRNHARANETLVDAGAVDLNDPENQELHNENFRWTVLIDDDVAVIRHTYLDRPLGIDDPEVELVESRATSFRVSRADGEDSSGPAGGPFRFELVDPSNEDAPRCLGLTNLRAHLMACSGDATAFVLENYASWRPTSSPTAPTTDAPSRSPTPDKGFPPVKEFLKNVVLLKSFVEEGSLLGLGMSPGDNMIPSVGDKLQIKSFLKNHDQGYLAALKMVWEHDEHFQLRPTQDALESPLALTSNKGIRSLNTRPVDKYGYVQLTESPNGQAEARATFHFVPYRGGYHIMVGNDDDGANGYWNLNLCLTAVACDPHVDFICRPNSDHVGCERSCDGERPNDKRQGIVNGSYVKLANCRDAFEEAQTFIRGVPEEFLDPATPAPASSPPAATPAPVSPSTPPVVSAPPSTLAPSAPPSRVSQQDAARDGEVERDDSGMIAGVVLGLLLLLLLVLLLLVLRRRKRKEQQRKDYQARMHGSGDGFLGGDDDDQDQYASFETDKLKRGAADPLDAGSSDGSGEAGAVEPPSPGSPAQQRSANSLQERMIRSRGSKHGFDAQPLDQETGFVARV